MDEQEKTMQSPEIKWNNKVRLVLSDIDETIAPVYMPADPETIH